MNVVIGSSCFGCEHFNMGVAESCGCCKFGCLPKRACFCFNLRPAALHSREGIKPQEVKLIFASEEAGNIAWGVLLPKTSCAEGERPGPVTVGPVANRNGTRARAASNRVSAARGHVQLQKCSQTSPYRRADCRLIAATTSEHCLK